MSPDRRYLLRVLIVLCGTALFGTPTPSGSTIVAGPMATPDDASSCAELNEWASEYREKRVTLDDLAQFDRPHRLAIVGAVTPEVRASLWQEQMGRLAKRTDLSAAQREHVMDAIPLMTADLYRGTPAAAQHFKNFWDIAEGAFTSPEHKAAWFHLGVVTSTGEISSESLKPVAGRGISCNCRSTSDCLAGVCSGTSCSPVFACGPGGGQWCTARCV